MSAVTRFPLAYLARFTSAQIAVWTKAQDISRSGVSEDGRRPGCFARDSVLAAQLGMERSTVSGAFRVLEREGEVRVRESSGGRRTRWTRPARTGEEFVQITHAARDELAKLDVPLRLYAALAHLWAVKGRPAGGVALVDLGAADVAALGIKGEALRRGHRELEVRGWITKVAEGGGRGRVARYAVHEAPVRAVQLALCGTNAAASLDAVTATETAREDVEQTAAVDPVPGQLALFGAPGQEAGNPLGESPETPSENPRKPPLEIPHKKTVSRGLLEEDEGVAHRRRRKVRTVRETTAPTALASRRADRRSTARPERAPRGGKNLPPSEITVSRDAAAVLAAARPLLDRIPEHRQRSAQAAMSKAVRAHLARNEDTPDRLAARITRRLAVWMLEDVRDPVAWFTGYALRRRGCADPMCEDRVIEDTGEPCRACADGQTAPVAAVRLPECANPACAAPLRDRDAAPGTRCAGCQQAAEEDEAAAAAAFADLAARLGVDPATLAA
ncbi:MarR family transcriptional regulator [Streptomyces werraensis]|uniref:MarR family transcriptional regulator n=1 Tax=Streptomyces werraensis TaxID=68284 RepID=UPI0038048272